MNIWCKVEVVIGYYEDVLLVCQVLSSLYIAELLDPCKKKLDTE